MNYVVSLAKKVINVAENNITDEMYNAAPTVYDVDYDWACEMIYLGDVEECIEVIRDYMEFLNCFPAQYWIGDLKDEMEEIQNLLKN